MCRWKPSQSVRPPFALSQNVAESKRWYMPGPKNKRFPGQNMQTPPYNELLVRLSIGNWPQCWNQDMPQHQATRRTYSLSSSNRWDHCSWTECDPFEYIGCRWPFQEEDSRCLWIDQIYSFLVELCHPHWCTANARQLYHFLAHGLVDTPRYLCTQTLFDTPKTLQSETGTLLTFFRQISATLENLFLVILMNYFSLTI